MRMTMSFRLMTYLSFSTKFSRSVFQLLIFDAFEERLDWYGAGLHIVRLFEKKTGSIASTSVLRRSDGGIHSTTSFSQTKVQ